MSALEANLYDNWAQEDRREKRGLRLSLAVAAVLHGGLLAVAVPEYSAAPAAASDKKVLYVVQTPRFRQQTPPPTDTRLPVTYVPIPDPDPQAIEPYVSDDELSPPPVLADVDDTAFFELPDAPPAPPEPEKLVYRVGEVDPPERLHDVEPRYTELARRIRLEGTVILQATIDARGDVVDLQVLKGLGMGLTEEAVAAVEQWKFRPSTVGGRPVAVLYVLTVHFKLR
ncbi:MAG TPA: energy transducer TonB [Thermoanaerobaculia bacterium]|jgi:protein TonB